MADRSTVRAILEILLDHARSVMRQKGFQDDSCIASTRVVLDLCRNYGITAIPLAVTAVAYNPKYAAAIEAGEKPPSGDPVAQAAWMDKRGAWSIGVGLGGDPRPRRWPGHLGALLYPDPAPADPLFIDISIDQASRPQYDLHLSPVFFPASEEWRRGEEPMVIQMRNGAVLKYDAKPRNTGYLGTPDWVDNWPVSEITERLKLLVALKRFENAGGVLKRGRRGRKP